MMGHDQGIDLRTKRGIVLAGVVEKGVARAAVPPNGRVEDVGDLSPAISVREIVRLFASGRRPAMRAQPAIRARRSRSRCREPGRSPAGESAEEPQFSHFALSRVERRESCQCLIECPARRCRADPRPPRVHRGSP